MESLSGMIVIGCLTVVGIYLILQSRSRKAVDVAVDLSEEADRLYVSDGQDRSSKRDCRGLKIGDELGSIGLFNIKERDSFALKGKLTPIVFALLFVLGGLIGGLTQTRLMLMACVLGLAIGYLVSKSRYRRKKENYIKELEFFLPIVMERLVMAVEAGLDIIAAIKAVLDLEAATRVEQPWLPGQSKRDPVTKLLEIVYQLTESGLSFDVALHDVAVMVECSALRHAFIHLAMAHTEGGELVMPLRELSDSTQLYFQESVEEDIAKMPVKATMPLLCTFTGLIICFVTTPLIQVISIIDGALPK
ncbi:hypothetical protein OAO01_08860 [Oligoflexia bacterium]|nr:hypothetical protein [Oligoflexia bacterium]